MKKGYFLPIVVLSLVAFNEATITGHYEGKGLGTHIQASRENFSASPNTGDTTKEVVRLVNEAATLIRTKGESAFNELRERGSRWQKEEDYIFVLDPSGNMLVHPDPQLEGKNQIGLLDVNGKPIVRGLLSTTTGAADKREGWYHYEWPVPGGLLPRWKSSYVQMITAPSGARYIVGSGVYNDRMERPFVIDMVKDAVSAIEKDKTTAFKTFHDPKSPFMAKDAYIFVVDSTGVELVNPAFPNLEGRNLLDLKDTRGKYLVREMLKTVQLQDSGWVDYMWPKPGESISTQKSTYVRKAKLGDQWVMVGCGVYLADAQKATSLKKRMAAPELMSLVRDAATVFEKEGENAYPEFRKKGSRWFNDETYFVVWSLDGIRTFHAADPSLEQKDMKEVRDVMGRPYGKMIFDIAAASPGEGWVHYLYPEPGDIFPTWKSTFVKRVTFPSQKQYMIGCGIYNMQMDGTFIEDIVNRAADLVAAKGKQAFPALRDKTGPYVFMATYVFVDNPAGTELVNAAQPSVEGMNLMESKDANGKYAVREYIDKAMKYGRAWVEYYWYKPGESQPVLKHSYVRKVLHGNETYIVGSGFYSQNEGVAFVPR